jgi:MFS superfamily sulfate permease-like transporter
MKKIGAYYLGVICGCLCLFSNIILSRIPGIILGALILFIGSLFIKEDNSSSDKEIDEIIWENDNDDR